MTATITTNCPEWCEEKHKGETWGEETDLHFRYFGDGHENGDAYVYLWAEISLEDGSIKSSQFGFNIEESTDPEDMEEVAKWCLEAAACMREIRGTAKTPLDHGN